MSECIEAPGQLNSSGYKRIKRGGRRVLAHRWAYAQVFGPIPAGMVVRHRCDNRVCWFIEHLEIGTQSDNVQDSIRRGRHRPSPGEKNGMSKLTAEQVGEIRTLWPEQGLTQQEVADRFGITRSLVSLICNDKAWRAAA